MPWCDGPAFFAKLKGRPREASKAPDFPILAAARSGEIFRATWDEIDFNAASGRFPRRE
jgi:hypothetical protein